MGERNPSKVTNGLSSRRPQETALFRESFLSLCTSLGFARDKRPHSLMVTSAGPQEGKSTVAANLALAMAHGGERVLLIDADLRRPVLHNIFGRERNPGLTDLFQGSFDFGRAEELMSQVTTGLHFLSSGSLSLDPTGLFRSTGFERLLEGLRNQFGAIILDSSPVLLATEARLQSLAVDGVLLVLGAGRVTREEAQRTRAHLEKAGSRILGAILNHFDQRYAPAYYSHLNSKE